MISLKPRGTGYAPEFVEQLLRLALKQAGNCPVFAITGLQGTGKSTLSAQIAELAIQRDMRVTVLSIDDFYLPKAQRIALANQIHPLLATRGPPGTHDVALACQTIDALQQGKPTALPQFDKIADERIDSIDWPIQAKPDFIIFEGWFLKVPPRSHDQLAEPINSLERDLDQQGIWRSYCNKALSDYKPLWQRINHLVFLQGPGFDHVLRWRSEQEKTLQAGNPDRSTMSAEQIAQFILFFERISRQALSTLPAIADTTIRVDAQRIPLL